MIVLNTPTATRFLVYANANGVFASAVADAEGSWAWFRDPVRAAAWPQAHTVLLGGASQAEAYALHEIADPAGTLTVKSEFTYSRAVGDAEPAFSLLLMENHAEDTPEVSADQYDVGVWIGATILTWDVPEAQQGAAGLPATVAVNTANEYSGVSANLYFASDAGLAEAETLLQFMMRARVFGVVNNSGTNTVALSSLTFGAKLHALVVPDAAAQWLPEEATFDALAPDGLTVVGGGIRLRSKLCLED